MTNRTNNVPEVTHSRPSSPSSSEPCSLGDFTSRQVWARMVSLSATPSTHPNNGRILRASPDCCRRYTIYSTEAFLKPTVYQVLFWRQKWRRERERLNLYTHRSDTNGGGQTSQGTGFGEQWELSRVKATSGRTAKIQNTDNCKGWRGCGATGTVIHCWWECKMLTTTLEDSLAASHKTKHTLTIRSRNDTAWYLPTGVKNAYPHKTLHTVFSSFIRNCQNLEVIKVSSDRWMDKQMVYPDNGILFSSEKKWAIKL